MAVRVTAIRELSERTRDPGTRADHRLLCLPQPTLPNHLWQRIEQLQSGKEEIEVKIITIAPMGFATKKVQFAVSNLTKYRHLSNFPPLKVMDRYHNPQLQMGEN